MCAVTCAAGMHWLYVLSVYYKRGLSGYYTYILHVCATCVYYGQTLALGASHTSVSWIISIWDAFFRIKKLGLVAFSSKSLQLWANSREGRNQRRHPRQSQWGSALERKQAVIDPIFLLKYLHAAFLNTQWILVQNTCAEYKIEKLHKGCCSKMKISLPHHLPVI